MGKFNRLYKRDLTNAQHFAFIQAYITAATAAGFTAQRIVTALAAIVAAFANEDRYYMQFRASEIVAQRTAADQRRDTFYSRLHRLVQAWAGSGMAQLDAAATALLKVFNLYKVKVSAQIDEYTVGTVPTVLLRGSNVERRCISCDWQHETFPQETDSGDTLRNSGDFES